ncbi:hypothetical protein [Novipirellula sp.]|uniref:hypothetical protein n=1 Tax=Novipirellula sp. TaxID=2795430 RepID=UPI00356A34DF
MDVPSQFARYPCGDYFASSFAEHGHWCEPSQLWVILPARQIEELTDFDGSPLDFLRVGDAGVNGIPFGYRIGHAGVWAYYPIDSDFVFIASSVQGLVDRWDAGKVTL